MDSKPDTLSPTNVQKKKQNMSCQESPKESCANW